MCVHVFLFMCACEEPTVQYVQMFILYCIKLIDDIIDDILLHIFWSIAAFSWYHIHYVFGPY